MTFARRRGETSRPGAPDGRPGRMDIVLEPAVDPEARRRVAEALLAFNAGFLGPYDPRPVTLALRDGPGGRIDGGLWGRIAHRWLFVEMLFVPESARGRGLGGALLARAEAEARAAGCVGVWLDTFSPDAKRFYERNGFREAGAIADQPPGRARWLMAKRLDGA